MAVRRPFAASKESSPASVVDVKLSDVTIESVKLFQPLDRVLRFVHKFKKLTPVQAELLPLIKAGKNMFVRVDHGTGKTLAFLVPTLDTITRKLNRHPRKKAMQPKILIVSPRRKLSYKIGRHVRMLLKFMPQVSKVVVFGGPESKDTRLLQSGVDVLIGTAERLLYHLDYTPGIPTGIGRHVRVLVIDRVDELVATGLREHIRRIVAACPPKEKRQTLLFSATTSLQVEWIRNLALPEQHEFIDFQAS